MKVIDSKEVYKGSVFSLRTDIVEIPTGKHLSRDVIVHPGAVVILPVLENGNVIVIKQYRHSISKEIFEFPAGTLKLGEDPKVCAERELMEEIEKFPSELISLGTIYPTPGICDEIQYCYLGKGLIDKSLDADEDEFIEKFEMTVSEVELAIKDGSFSDAKSIAIFCRARVSGLL